MSLRPALLMTIDSDEIFSVRWFWQDRRIVNTVPLV